MQSVSLPDDVQISGHVHMFCRDPFCGVRFSIPLTPPNDHAAGCELWNIFELVEDTGMRCPECRPFYDQRMAEAERAEQEMEDR